MMNFDLVRTPHGIFSRECLEDNAKKLVADNDATYLDFEITARGTLVVYGTKDGNNVTFTLDGDKITEQ